MPDLTTTEAAVLLTERGMAAEDGGPVRPRTVKQWCQRGLFVGAYHTLDKRRGAWYIPAESVEVFAGQDRPAGWKLGTSRMPRRMQHR